MNIRVNNCKNDNTIFNNKNWVEYTDEIKKAIEKQIRENPIKKYYKDLDCGELYEEGYTFYCPECENEVGATSLTFKEMDWQTEYCCDCGQRLDWN